MSNIRAPITIFSIVLALPYFSLEESFCTKPIDVPATIARRAISTGVEQGEEKTPPRIPAMKAPK